MRITFILIVFINTLCFSQSILTGKVFNTQNDKPVEGVEIYLFYRYSTDFEQILEATSNSKGKFEVDCSGIPIPTTFFIRIKKGDLIDIETYKIVNPNELIELPVFIDVENSEKRLGDLIKRTGAAEKNINGIKNLIEGENSIIPEWVQIELEELSVLLQEKQDTINKLQEYFANNTYEIEIKDRKIRKQDREMENLSARLGSLKSAYENSDIELEEAHLKIVNCFCEGSDKDFIKVGFNILNRENEYVNFGKKRIRMEVEKLNNVSRNGKKKKITNISSNQTYIDTIITFPQNRIVLNFRSELNEFKSASNNYYIKLYNLSFRTDVDLYELEISNLRTECFKRANLDREIIFRNKEVLIKNQMNVHQNKLELFISDDQPDGDVISIYLNERLIIENFTTKKEGSKFDVELNDDENILIIESVDIGELEPNTTKVSISDGIQNEIISVKSYKEKSGGVRLLRKY